MAPAEEAEAEAAAAAAKALWKQLPDCDDDDDGGGGGGDDVDGGQYELVYLREGFNGMMS